MIASIAARHEDPGALTAWGLYFIAPDDTHYEIGTAPGYGWNFRLQAWSPSGQRLLATVWNEETEQEQVWLVDLVSGSMEVAAEADHGGWIGATFVTDDRISVTRGIEGSTTLELIDLSTGNALARAEQYFDPDSQDPWLYMYPATSQQIGDHWVTVAHSGIQVHDIAGNLEGTLPLPGLACLATRAWDTSTILVECADPAGESDPDFEVWGYTASRGLWLVPLDGSPTTRLAGPGWFSNAFTIGDTTLLETSGCCECGGGVQFEGAESWWNPPEYEPCRPEILGLRNGHFLIQDLLTQERHVSILFEIDEAGAMLAPITDATGPYGGLMMALLWEG